MKSNISSADRTKKAAFPVFVAVLYFTGIISGTTGLVLLIAGGILALTSAINFFPIYHTPGMSTKKA